MNAPSDAPPAPAPRSAWVWLLLLNAAVFLAAHGPALRRPLCANDDVRQQIFWMQQWRDPALYPADPLVAYARHYVPWGVQGVYWLAARVADPVDVARWLPGVLFVALGCLFFRIGRRLAGPAAGWGVVAVFWLMPFFLEHLAGGLARSFAAPLLALFVLAWLERWPGIAGAALWLQALCIPYLAPVCAGAALLARGGWAWPATRRQFAGFAGALAVALGWGLAVGGAGHGPWAAGRELDDPVFSAAGRYAVWPPASLLYELTVVPWERIAPFREGSGAAGAAVTVLLLAGTAVAARRVDWRALAPARPLALGLAATAVAAFVAARLFALRLFIPNRYVIYPVHAAYAILLGLAAAAAWRAWAPRPRTTGALLVVAAAALGALRLRDAGLYDFSADAPVIAAARALPKDARLAGPPALMDNVLAFGRRRVLVSFELAQPWLRGYWRRIEPRLREWFAAYYAADPNVIRAFCARWDVDYLVVDERDFPAAGRPAGAENPRAPDFLRGRPFFAPFDQEIREQLAGRSHFAILSPSNFPYLRLDADRRLLDMRRGVDAAPTGGTE